VSEQSEIDRLLKLLGGIKPEHLSPPEEEPLAQEEQVDFAEKGEEEHAKLDILIKRLHAIGLKQDIGERKSYANKIFWLVCGWLGIVLLLVALSGANGIGIAISDAVLISLVSGVSVNIIALFAIVANYLFPRR